MRLILPSILLGSLAGGALSGAAAQSPAESALLDRYWDSLHTVTDTAALTMARRELTRLRKGDAGPLVELQEGFAELRMAQLGRPERSGDAAKAFMRANKSRRDMPYAWYGYGLAKLARARWLQANTLNIGTRVGEKAMVEALEAFRQVLVLDPSFEPAISALAGTALQLRTPDRMERALGDIRPAMAGESAFDPETYLLVGRLETLAGRPEAALTAFGDAARSGAPMGLVRLEVARVLLARGDSGADSIYFAGAASSNPESVAGYRQDIQYIASDDELAAYDELDAAARPAWLEDFWQRRDDWDLRPGGTRLYEHYGRLAYARTHFWLDVTRRHYWAEARYVSDQLEFDDRGIIYIRHGPPAKRVTPFVYAATANESWRYDRADGEWLLHFCAQGDLRDYRLIESALDIADSRCNTGGVRRDQLLTTRYDLSLMYSRIATWGPYGRARLVREERDIGRASIAEGTTTDSHELSFTEGLPALLEMLVVGQSPDGSLVHLVFGLDAVTAGAAGPYRIRAAFFDSVRQAVASVDTVVAPPEGPWPNGRSGALVSLPVPPGRWLHRVAIQRGDSSGTLFPADSIVVHDFGGGLSLSELMVGTSDLPLAWRPTMRDTVFIDPWRTVGRRDVIELYYEVYGLEAGEFFTTRLEVRRKKSGGLLGGLFGGTPGGMSFQYAEAAQGGVTHVKRQLDLATLEDGAYWLEVEVTDSTGVTTTRRTDLFLDGEAARVQRNDE